jgi:hypothetical protein
MATDMPSFMIFILHILECIHNIKLYGCPCSMQTTQETLVSKMVHSWKQQNSTCRHEFGTIRRFIYRSFILSGMILFTASNHEVTPNLAVIPGLLLYWHGFYSWTQVFIVKHQNLINYNSSQSKIVIRNSKRLHHYMALQSHRLELISKYKLSIVTECLNYTIQMS